MHKDYRALTDRFWPVSASHDYLSSARSGFLMTLPE